VGIPRLVSIFITFNVINVGWVFFRAKDIRDAMNVCEAMIGLNARLNLSTFLGQGAGRLEALIALLIISISISIVFVCKNSNIISNGFRPSSSTLLRTLMLILLGLLFLNSSVPKEFIYNDF
jgi:alginate O-acetyltransferase complex protein AlgI